MSAHHRLTAPSALVLILLGLGTPHRLSAQDVVPSRLLDHDSLNVRESGSVRVGASPARYFVLALGTDERAEESPPQSVASRRPR